MKIYNRKIYLTAFILSIISTSLLIAGMILHRVTGRNGLVPLIILSVLASIFAIVGIVLLCIDIKSKNRNNLK